MRRESDSGFGGGIVLLAAFGIVAGVALATGDAGQQRRALPTDADGWRALRHGVRAAAPPPPALASGELDPVLQRLDSGVTQHG